MVNIVDAGGVVEGMPHQGFDAGEVFAELFVHYGGIGLPERHHFGGYR